MASVISHAIAALGIGALFYRVGMSKRILVAGAVCSVVPDFDVIGFDFGIRYGDFWGHRGFTIRSFLPLYLLRSFCSRSSATPLPTSAACRFGLTYSSPPPATAFWMP